MADPPDPDPSADPTQTIGGRLREARRAAGLTQREAGERIGFSRRAIFEWENDIHRPTVALPQLAELYGVSALFLAYGPDPASAEVAALRADLVTVIDGLNDQAARLREERELLVRLAESIEAALAEIRRIVEIRAHEIGGNPEAPDGES